MPRPPLGAWKRGPAVPRSTPAAWRAALEALGQPLTVVDVGGRPAVAEGGDALLGAAAHDELLPLLAHVPALLPGQLGAEGFRQTYGARLAYVVGEMANGIASEALVEAAAAVGAVGVFGAAGLPVDRVTAALERLQRALPGPRQFGVNLIHSPDDQRLEAELVELFLARGLRFVSASAYLDLTLPVVKYRVAGIHRDADGRIVVPNALMAKVSRVEVARKFFEPPPRRFLEQLVRDGFLTEAQADLASHVPMADDVTAEADSGGHTDNRPLVLLLPALLALRDEVCRTFLYAEKPRVGAGGGLATPASVASAFSMGAAYVVTGSINQATLEAGTSDTVRALLAQAGPTDVAMAPAADMFEMGVKVQVLSRGTLFAVRGAKLYELYKACASVEALPAAARAELEQKYFRCTLEEAWAGVEAFFSTRDPSQLARAAKDPKHKLALLFRSYLGQASRWANAGVADRTLDYQVWCGPAMGAFNEWAKGGVLERWEARRAGLLARNLMVGAAVLTRVAALRTQGVEVPAELAQFSAHTDQELDALLAATPTRVEAPVTQPAPAPAAGRAAHATEPIAIVGLGALFPSAPNLEAFWRLLRTGKDAVGEIPASHWSLADYFDADQHAPDKTYAKRGAFLPATPFDPTEWGIPPSILEATDTAQLLGLVVARMAMEDAGYVDGAGFDRARASVILGVTGTQELVITLGSRLGHPKWRQALKDSGLDEQTVNEVVSRISESYVSWQENSFPGLLGNVVAGRIANRLDFGGTNCVIDAACASSLGAVHLAVQELRSGHADLVLTGGVDCLNDIFMHMCFSKTPALSASGDVRPFSDKADGTLLGEGLGMVVLKRLSDAERDGDRVYAVIRSVGTSSDGRAKSIYAPLAKGQARALRSAYQQAGVRPRDIALLEAHGTGTKAGDAAEVEALTAVYREDSADAAWCTLGSVKSQVGHTKAAAGAAGLIKAALALHHKVLPPSLKVEAPNPALQLDQSPFSITGQARPWLTEGGKPRLAAVSSFGFGGSNFHLVLQEHGGGRGAPSWDGSVELVALSGSDAAAVAAKGRALVAAPHRELALSEARRAFRSTDAVRLTAVLPDDGLLDRVLGPALERLSRGGPTEAFSLDGVWVGVGRPAGTLGFLFPGQGSQHVDMLRELATVFPELLETVEADQAIARAVYPLATFDAAERARREAQLTRTEVAQPAIGAVSRGLLQVLGRFGVMPAAVAGHSYGELVALHAAGVLEVRALTTVSHLRGSLMGANGADRGTMLAVLAPLAEVTALLESERLDLVLANRNGPAQGVLSGARAEIDRAEQRCQAKGLRTARLNVGAAFHSPLVSGAAARFREGLEAIDFGLPRVPVIANSTAQAYPADPRAAKDLLGQQLALPVKFDEVVERLYALGVRTFVEVGPKTALTGMVKATLTAREHTALAIDGGRRGLFELGAVLARLAAEGHVVRLEAWQDAPKPPRWVQKAPRVPKMAVPLTGANYRAPYTPRPPSAPKRPVAQVVSPPVAVAAASSPIAPPQAEALAALQAMAEQTARLHQAFLDTQLAAQQSLAAMLQGASVGVARPTALVATPSTAASGSVAAATASDRATPRSPQVASAPPVAPARVSQGVDVVGTLLTVVAETTGYPRETLDLAMDLEADLGIDSIKRVEILSTLARRIPGAPSVNPEKLGALRTLRSIVEFIGVPAVASPAPAATSGAVDVVATLLSVVAETTGYPRETLDLAMDLEADLGIDSIKRVEILSALSRRVPGAPSVNPEKLGALRTLRSIVEFIGVPTPAAGPSVAAAPAVAPASAVDVNAVLLQVVSELTGYPAQTLQLGMDLEADLGIDSIKRVEILSALARRVPGAPSVNPEKLGSLRTLQQVADFVGAAVPSTAAPLSASAPAPASQPTSVDAQAALLQVVSELTGYPESSLQLGMDLEADLGIDSIKRVEILSALARRVPGAPSVNPEKLGSLRTLQQVVEFITSAAPPRSAPVASTPAATLDVASTVLAVVAELTGYPVAALQLSMDLEADLGIDSIKRVEILSALSRRLPQAPNVNPEKLGSLRTLQQVADFVGGGAAQPATPAVSKAATSPTRTPVKTEPISRRVVVPVRAGSAGAVPLPAGPIALFGDDEQLAKAIERRLVDSGARVCRLTSWEAAPAELGGVVLLASRAPDWTKASEDALKAALKLARTLGPTLKNAGPNTFLVTVSRRDGAFGFSAEAPVGNPLGGGLAGLAKTAAHEWPTVRCRAFDVAATLSDDEAAIAIALELTNDGPREVGLGPAGRLTLALRDEAVVEAVPAVGAGEVVVVTGGARGVTAVCAEALAVKTGATLLLLGRSPVPEAEPEWLRAAVDEAGVKRALLEHAEGPKPTPKVLGDQTRAVLAAREIRGTLERLRGAGVRAEYRSVDVRDEAAVQRVLATVRTELGPIRGVLHGAGVLRDRRIEDKRDDDFDQVLDPKLAGARALVRATAEDDLKFLGLFASVTGRFGRRGQVDYAVANQALVSIARAEALARPTARVVAFDWGPWEGGMVTPSLKAEFEKEGIALISLAVGAEACVHELGGSSGGPVEVVIGALFGEAVPADWALHRAYRVDPSWPVLVDHQLAGRAVVPLALTLEWFAQAVEPGAALEDVRVLKGVTVGEAPEDVAVWVSAPQRTERGVRRQLELRSATDQVHVRAVAAWEERPRPEVLAVPTGLRPFGPSVSTVYAEQLFHGPSLRAIESIEGVGEHGMVLELRVEPTSERWLPTAARAWRTGPLTVDGVFQALIVWCRAQQGAPSLPSRLGAWRQFAPLASARVKAVVRVRSVEGASVESDVDLLDASGALLARLEGYVCTMSPSLDRAFTRGAVVATPIVPAA